MQLASAFLSDIDACWAHPAPDKIHLRVIGSSALMMQTSYFRGTKDSDVIQTDALDEKTQKRLLALAGPDTALHAKHRMYLDIVPRGLPLLPQRPIYHAATELNAALRHFEVELLDVVDVVVSKLKRFNANDRSDIDAMIELELAPHDAVLDRFRRALDFHSGDERLVTYVANFHAIERDSFVRAETPIDLPE